MRRGERSLQDDDKIKKEWNSAVEAWVDFVRTGKDYYREGLNNPATFELIGDVKGLVVLDLACGEGYNTRILARRGAEVIGVDFSERMIRFARQTEEKEKLGICYRLMDAANLGEVSNNYFDLVTCFMSLQDIKDFRKAISEVARVLKEGGRFIFSIPHPCTEQIRLNKHEGKMRAAERYFGAMEYTINWNMKRLTKHFRTTSFHRPLTAYFDALCRCRLLVKRLVEPQPRQAELKRFPGLQDVQAMPQSVIVESIKRGDDVHND
jgi:ubiquinone/menaquinone biosynthesis C-methylase UbiE